MKRQICLALAAVLVVGAVAHATSSFEVNVGLLGAPQSVYLEPSGEPGTGWWYSYAEAQAGNGGSYQLVQDGVGGFYVDSPTALASASVTGPNASATGSTSMGAVSVSALANTGPGSSASYAWAEQIIWFGAMSQGDVTFSLNYAINQALSILPGESASTDASVGLSLFRDDYSQVGSEQLFYIFHDAAGGYNHAGSLSVSGWFEEGAMGYVRIRVDGNATAAVPAPGAALLGAMGVGLMGLLRKRTR